jgi:hypothetical protein
MQGPANARGGTGRQRAAKGRAQKDIYVRRGRPDPFRRPSYSTACSASRCLARSSMISKVRKFGERRHRAVPQALFVPGLAPGLTHARAFPHRGATVAGHSRWAAGGRSAPGVQRHLCATIPQSRLFLHQRKVPRLLERLGSSASSPTRQPLSVMVGYAWSYSASLRQPRPRYSV